MIIISIILAILSGISKAIKDKINFHYYDSVFNQKGNSFFWNPELSSLNKYKNQDPKQGPKFFGSTTFLVWLTDAWHLFDTIFYLLTLIMVALPSMVFLWWQAVMILILLWVIKSVTFELFFSKILKQK